MRKQPPRKSRRQPPHKPQATVIIPCRHTGHLAETITSVREHEPTAPIVVCYDGCEPLTTTDSSVTTLVFPTARGVGPSRHACIEAAQTPYVVTLDAHMLVHAGFVDAMLAPLKDGSAAVSCSSTRVAYESDDGLTIGPATDIVHTGAALERRDKHGWPFAVTWCDGLAPGTELQCALGACYAFSAQHYYDIGAPWSGGIGWGYCEQQLSMLTSFVGKKTVLADCETTHMYWREGQIAPYAPAPHLNSGCWVNAMRLLDMLPIPLSQLQHFRAGMSRSNLAAYGAHQYVGADSLSAYHLLWDDYCAKWWPIVAALPPAPPRRRIIGRVSSYAHGETPTACPTCGCGESYVYRTVQDYGAMTTRRDRVCRGCKRKWYTFQPWPQHVKDRQTASA